MKRAFFFVVCQVSAEVAAQLKAGGIDAQGITQVFSTKRAAMKCAAAWIASGLGPAEVA